MRSLIRGYSQRRFSFLGGFSPCLFLLAWSCSFSLYAKPEGFKLKAGVASEPCADGSGTFVIESVDRAIIEWDSFSIAELEHVRFLQQGLDASVLNRVVGPDPSSILGRLSSNGTVYLINPNGILIGPTGSVEALGFIGSSFDILDRDFLEDSLHCLRGEGAGEISVQGQIRTKGGDLIIAAKKVDLTGSLEAVDGSVGIGAGSEIWIQPKGKSHLYIKVSSPLSPEEALGRLSNPYTAAIRHRGKIDALSQVERGGEVYLVAQEATAEVSGSIVARKNLQGGVVHVLGERIHLLDEAKIDVSGECGGGTVLIGGDYQGGNPEIQNALAVWTGDLVRISADAKTEGNGGKVIVWGNEANTFFGRIDIRGGAAGGDGGLAEVSGKMLNYLGRVEGMAPLGKSGLLLLDPSDIVINASATSGSFTGCGAPPSTYTINTGVATNNILVGDLTGQLASCSTTISTLGGGGSGTNNGSITISSSISWSAATTLTLVANSFINATNVSVTNTSASTGFNAIVMAAQGSGAASNSAILISGSSTVSAVGGNIFLYGITDTSGTPVGGVFLSSTATVSTTSGTINIAGQGSTGSGARGVVFNSANSAQVSSASGAINISGITNSTGFGGVDWAGVTVNFATTNTVTFGSTITCPAAGLIPSSITGCKGGTGTPSHGLSIRGNALSQGPIVATNSIIGGTGSGSSGVAATSSLSTSGSSAGIQITASSSATAGAAHGISLTGGTLQTTGGGTITLNGTAGASTTAAAHGVNISGGSISTSTNNGSISITGTASGTNASYGILVGTTNGISAGSGSVTLSGTSSSNATNAHGIRVTNAVANITTGTGSLTFQNCQGGTGTSCYGVEIANTISLGGAGSIIATNSIRSGNGAGPTVGFHTSANVTSSGGNISIAASGQASSGQNWGILIDGASGKISTTSTGTITLVGTCANTAAAGNAGLQIDAAGGNVTTVSGSLSVAGAASGGTNGAIGLLLTASNALTSTSGQIFISGTSASSGTGAHGVSIQTNSQTTGTSALVTFGSSITAGSSTVSGCSGGTGNSSHGVNFSTAFTTSGGITFTNITGGTSPGTTCNGINVAAAISAAGAITGTSITGGTGSGGIGFNNGANFATSSGAIQMTATSPATAGAAHGISINAGTLRTTGGGTITLNGTGGASTTAASHGIDISSTGVVSGVTGGGSLSLTGAASGSSSSCGVRIAVDNGIISSSTATIGLSGSSTASGSSSHGVSIVNALTTGVSGLTTFSSCSGGSGSSSHGVTFGAAFTTSGGIAFNGITGGISPGTSSFGVNVGAAISAAGAISSSPAIVGGSGSGGIGFNVLANFSTSSGNLQISASSPATAGTAHGISVSTGTLSDTGGGSITLTGTGGASTTAASHGINISGTGIISAALGGGSISLQGTASGSQASNGIFLGVVNGVVTSGTGTISIAGASSASLAGAHGVNIAATWTTGTSGLVSFANCSGGSGGASHAINAQSAFSTAGSITAVTGIVGGSGASSYGFNGTANFASSGGGTIAITASSTGSTTDLTGISLTSGTMSTTGAGTITLIGTASATTTGGSKGINLNGATLSTGSGAVSLTGTVPLGASGTCQGVVFVPLTINNTGTVSVTGTSNATGSNSYGVNSSSAYSSSTTSLLSFIGTGGSGTSGHGINLQGFVSAAGAVTLTGTPGSDPSSYGTSMSAGGVITAGGVVTVSGSVLLQSATAIDTTNGAPAGADILFSGSTTTIDGAAAATQGLTLTAGTSGAITFGGVVGGINRLAALSIVSAKTTANAVNIGGNISCTSFGITTLSPVTLTGSSATIDSTPGALSFPSTISGTSSGAQALTLTTSGAISLVADVGTSLIPLGQTTVSSGSSGLSLSSSISSVFATGFAVAGTVPTSLSLSVSNLTVNTSSGSGGISFGGTINGSRPLILSAGAGNIQLSSAVGAVTPLTSLTTTSSGGTTFASTLATNGSGGIHVTSATAQFQGNVTTTGSGPVSISNSGLLTISNGVNMAVAGDFTQSGGGTVATGGNINLNNTIDAPGSDITFTDPVTLTQNILLNSSVTGGDISFLSTVNGGFNLTLQAGAGNITMAQAAGGITPLSALTVSSCNNWTAAALAAASLTQTTGSGTSTFNGLISTTSNISLTGTAFTFNANATSSAGLMSIANTGVLTIASGVVFNINQTFAQTGIGSVLLGGTINTSNANISFQSLSNLIGPSVLDSGAGIGDITLNSTVNGGQSLTLIAGLGTVTFSAPVGSTTPLTSLEVSGATISTLGNHLVSLGPMSYTGATIIGMNTSFINGGTSGGTLFTGTITGNYNLTINCGFSSVEITGDVDTSGAASAGPTGSNGGNITVTANDFATVGGQILAQGGDVVAGTGGAGGNVSISSNEGSVSVHNINTSGGNGTVAGGEGGDISIDPTASTTNGFPNGLIILNADLSSGLDGNLVSAGGAGLTSGSGGSILLSANRTSATKVATIVSSLAGNDVSIFGDNLTIGNHEAMTILGSLTVVLDTSATLSDTVVLEDFSLITSAVFLLLHGNIQILDSFGSLYTSPSLHFLSGQNYSAFGTFIPSGPVDARSLGKTAAEFGPLLLFGSTILNYDTTAPIGPSASIDTGIFLKSIYELAIAQAQLSDKLPILDLFPYPMPNLCVQEDHLKRRCRYRIERNEQEFRRWNYGFRDSIRPQ